uniref:Signal recognition particle receptor subunit beta n=1 Tax=Solanum tuberosum TaxID=4113 RepID=M1BVH2_SOLTU
MDEPHARKPTCLALVDRLVFACSSIQHLTPLYSLGFVEAAKHIFSYQLRDGSAHQGTVTSMEPYVGSFILHSEEDKKGKLKPVLVVNVQGHSRLRPKLDEILPQAAGVVFVVDSVEFLPNCRPASDYKLRTSRTVVSDAHISNEYTLGVPGEPFAFSQCHNRVIVAEASGLTGEISQLEKFIRENVKP